jgi:EpsI family protein
VSWPRYAAALASVLLSLVWLQVALGRAVPLRSPLKTFPLRLGPWVGSAEEPDPEAVRRTRPDAVLLRRYVDPRGRVVVLYVAYFARDASRAQIQAACWGDCQVRELRLHRLRLHGRPVEVNRALVIQDGEPMAVLYWYQQGRSVLADPYRGKLEQARRALIKQRSDGALVRISVPVVGEVEEAVARAERFAAAALPVILTYMPE